MSSLELIQSYFTPNDSRAKEQALSDEYFSMLNERKLVASEISAKKLLIFPLKKIEGSRTISWGTEEEKGPRYEAED